MLWTPGIDMLRNTLSSTLGSGKTFKLWSLKHRLSYIKYLNNVINIVSLPLQLNP
jgi:hypothetical protein